MRALDAAFSHVKHGGDRESRKLIAARLVEAARSGITALDELTAIGRPALIDLRSRSPGEWAELMGRYPDVTETARERGE